jgi:uncharacterized protein (DUF305 family)
MHVNRTTVAAAVALSAIVALGGCATDAADDMPMTDGSVTGQAMHNDADVAFAQMMIPHHEQAVTMAGYALDRASDPAVRALAEQIAGAQGPEISTMTGWLDGWGASTMSDHSGHAMPGMMSDAAMERLSGLSGKDFDRMFLRMMVAHHQGALVMAESALIAGSDPEVERLAQEIIDAQQAEIEQMRQMLAEGD